MKFYYAQIYLDVCFFRDHVSIYRMHKFIVSLTLSVSSLFRNIFVAIR